MEISLQNFDEAQKICQFILLKINLFLFSFCSKAVFVGLSGNQK
jgi:hypothetical protein